MPYVRRASSYNNRSRYTKSRYTPKYKKTYKKPVYKRYRKRYVKKK